MRLGERVLVGAGEAERVIVGDVVGAGLAGRGAEWTGLHAASKRPRKKAER